MQRETAESDDARHAEAGNRQAAPLSTLLQIAAIWVASDLGYYVLLPALGVSASYNAGAIGAALYYVFWLGIAAITFWPLYGTWALYSRWAMFENRLASSIIWSVAFVGCAVFAAYVLPSLPSAAWTQSWSPPEIRVATGWYFLPKSIEILFQQLLILALVLALSARRCSLRQIALCCAALFGGMHVLLAFGGVPLGYVIRFMIAASAFGLLFPYLLLRVPNGLAYSYILHWAYYAVSVVMPHIFAATVK